MVPTAITGNVFADMLLGLPSLASYFPAQNSFVLLSDLYGRAIKVGFCSRFVTGIWQQAVGVRGWNKRQTEEIRVRLEPQFFAEAWRTRPMLIRLSAMTLSPTKRRMPSVPL